MTVTAEDVTTLPAGWRITTLGEVAAFNPRRAVGTIPDEQPTSFVPMAAVDERRGAIADRIVRPFADVREGYTYFEEGDVLFAKITPCMQNGKHAIARHLENGIGFGTTEFHVIRPREVVTSEWIHYFVRQPTLLRDAEAHFTGAVGQQRVPDAYLASVPFPVPPLDEQRRITAILDEQMAAIEQARTAAEQQLAAARALPASYLRAVFESDEARAWPQVRLADVAETGSGTTPSRERSDYYAGAIPWVKTGELRDGDITDTEEHVSESALTQTSLRLLPVGTLLIAMYGQGQTRGRTGLLQVPATTNQACFAVLPNEAKFDPRYLQAWFQYSYLRLRTESEARGNSQPNLNGDVLREQMLSLPTREQQQRVVQEMNQAMGQTNALSENLEAQLHDLARVPSSLLSAAFRGEL